VIITPETTSEMLNTIVRAWLVIVFAPLFIVGSINYWCVLPINLEGYKCTFSPFIMIASNFTNA
jgi:hypothetical protein